MGVGAELIDKYEDGWTKWLAEEFFKPFIDEKFEVKIDTTKPKNA